MRLLRIQIKNTGFGNMHDAIILEEDILGFFSDYKGKKMAGSFKTYPRAILSHNEIEFDPNRVDRYGHNFKFMEQHISFKDNVLEEPLESILEIEQINMMSKDRIDEAENEEIDDDDEKDNDKKRKTDGKVEKPKRGQNSKCKRCSCIIQ